MLRLHAANGTELLDGVAAYPGVQLPNLRVREPRVGLRERNERPSVPDRKGVIGVERRPAAMTGLRIDHHCIHGVWLNLPLPPSAAPSADTIRRVEPLEHQPFRGHVARAAPRLLDVWPRRRRHRRRDDERTHNTQILEQLDDALAPPGEWSVADVTPSQLEQVVNDEHHRDFAEDSRA